MTRISRRLQKRRWGRHPLGPASGDKTQTLLGCISRGQVITVDGDLMIQHMEVLRFHICEFRNLKLFLFLVTGYNSNSRQYFFKPVVPHTHKHKCASSLVLRQIRLSPYDNSLRLESSVSFIGLTCSDGTGMGYWYPHQFRKI